MGEKMKFGSVNRLKTPNEGKYAAEGGTHDPLGVMKAWLMGNRDAIGGTHDPRDNESPNEGIF